MVYGPGLIRAYELENKHACMPRILLDQPLTEAWGEGPAYYEKNGSLIGYQKLWRLDDDGWRFFDFLQPFPNTPGMPVNINLAEATLDPVRKLIASGPSNHRGDERIYPKYSWLARYFNVVLQERPEISIEQVLLEG